LVLCRTIFWAEAGVIKSSLDDGSDVSVIATELGNITAIDVSLGNFAFHMIVELTLPSANCQNLPLTFKKSSLLIMQRRVTTK